MDRLAKDPEIHIYHYAPYEPTAAGRLMGRHATREEEVDRLLRGDVFVDLFRAVRQGLRASVESYSIKKLEPLYGLQREVELRDAGSSIVEFERWLAESETGSGPARSPQTDPTLLGIEGLQPRRLRLELASARLARRAAAGVGGADRRGAAAARAGGARGRRGAVRTSGARRRGGGSAVGGRPRGRGSTDSGAARPVAAGPAPQLASARGEGLLVALLPPDERPHGRGADRRA